MSVIYYTFQRNIGSTDGNGTAIEDTRVDWEVIQGSVTLSYESTVTDDNAEGRTENRFIPLEAGEIKIKATAFGFGESSVIFTITAIAPEPDE